MNGGRREEKRANGRNKEERKEDAKGGIEKEGNRLTEEGS